LAAVAHSFCGPERKPVLNSTDLFCLCNRRRWLTSSSRGTTTPASPRPASWSLAARWGRCLWLGLLSTEAAQHLLCGLWQAGANGGRKPGVLTLQYACCLPICPASLVCRGQHYAPFHNHDSWLCPHPQEDLAKALSADGEPMLRRSIRIQVQNCASWFLLARSASAADHLAEGFCRSAPAQGAAALAAPS